MIGAVATYAMKFLLGQILVLLFIIATTIFIHEMNRSKK
jgi:hypothetical protein